MGIQDLLTKKPKTQVALTSLGKQKVDEKGVDETTPDGKVLCHLKRHMQSNLSEIAEDTGLSYWRVKAICEKYASGEWRWIEWV